MDKSTENTLGIRIIIGALSKKYPEYKLGYYIEHYLAQDNSYVVVLSNNMTFRVHRFVAQIAEINIDLVQNDSFDRIISSLKTI